MYMYVRFEVSIRNIFHVIDINVAKREKYGCTLKNTTDTCWIISVHTHSKKMHMSKIQVSITNISKFAI